MQEEQKYTNKYANKNTNTKHKNLYINSRCASCEHWDHENQCCGDTDEFWERCARDGDYEDMENGSEYYDYYDDKNEENLYYKKLYKKELSYNKEDFDNEEFNRI